MNRSSSEYPIDRRVVIGACTHPECKGPVYFVPCPERSTFTLDHDCSTPFGFGYQPLAVSVGAAPLRTSREGLKR